MERIKDLREVLKTLSEEEIQALRKEIRLEKKTRFNRTGLSFQCYIPKKYEQYLPIVLSWLYDNGYIKKQTPYYLAQAAVILLMNNVLSKMKEKASASQSEMKNAQST